MKLSLRLLDDVASVNSMEAVTELSVTSGDPQTVFVQLIDAVRHRDDANAPAVRYMPAAGATMSLVFDNIDTAKKVTKVASQPFATDGSVWKVDLTTQDTAKLSGTVSLVFTLTEGTRVVSGRLQAALLVK